MPVTEETVRITIFPDNGLDTENASKYLGLKPKTLAIMRTNGNGPKFIKIGRIFYFLEDLDAWIAESVKVSSASQRRFVESKAMPA